jgi:predicted ATPase
VTSEIFNGSVVPKSQAANIGTRLKNRDRLRKILQETIMNNQRIATRWLVITGAPGSGKTTIITELKRRGFKTTSDPARQLFEAQVSAGQSKYEARANYMSVQRKILELMILTANNLNTGIPTFLDYSIPDNLAFLEQQGLEWPDEFMQNACRYIYQHAFLLGMPQQLEINPTSDPIRTETLEQRVEIHRTLCDVYTELGIPVTEVVGNVGERLNTITRIAAESK